jgi:hypothetical protein
MPVTGGAGIERSRSPLRRFRLQEAEPGLSPSHLGKPSWSRFAASDPKDIRSSAPVRTLSRSRSPSTPTSRWYRLIGLTIPLHPFIRTFNRRCDCSPRQSRTGVLRSSRLVAHPRCPKGRRGCVIHGVALSTELDHLQPTAVVRCSGCGASHEVLFPFSV